jgi:hypothetical protein
LIYSDAWAFLSYRGLTGNVLMVGETQPDQDTYAVSSDCSGSDPYTKAMASQNVNGYMMSTLYGNHASLTTMRVWLVPDLSCYYFPTIIVPPYQ